MDKRERNSGISKTRWAVIAVIALLLVFSVLPGTFAWYVESGLTTNVFTTKEVDVVIYENGNIVDGISFSGVIPGDDLPKHVKFGLDPEMSVVSYIRFYFKLDYNPYRKLSEAGVGKNGVHGTRDSLDAGADEYEDEAAEINANMATLYSNITDNNPCLEGEDWIRYEKPMPDGSVRTYFYYTKPVNPEEVQPVTVLKTLHIPEEWDNTMNYFQFSLEVTVDAIQERNFNVDFESAMENYDPWGIEGQTYIVQDLYDTRNNEYDVTLRGKSPYEKNYETMQ